MYTRSVGKADGSRWSHRPERRTPRPVAFPCEEYAMSHAETPPPALDPEVEGLTQALAAPFARKFVKFRPGATSGSRALAIPYVDARVIQDRLDEVLGPVNWQDEYEF